MNDDFAAWNKELKDDGKGPAPLDDPDELSRATADAMFSALMETAYRMGGEYEDPQIAMMIVARSMRYAAELLEDTTATLCAPVEEREADKLGYQSADEFYRDYPSALSLRGLFSHIAHDGCDGVHSLDLDDGSVMDVTVTDGKPDAHVHPWWTLEDE